MSIVILNCLSILVFFLTKCGIECNSTWTSYGIGAERYT